ncbi:zinc-binding metallopeptidase [Marinifilum sp. D737]|uniref:zinc-binding metallopeptidase n=1 Tax=Marinifilum sp. D737 TaxID=2969628 RepID=UPI002273EF44|nr:putative zinc-binding metallopeptidase [Marinifilum sp. D737]MCY1635993.1 putative zinc-binding metallopeptidase [Marinifilum sp. D737]
MKKYICFLMLGVFLFGSCSNDEDLGESLIDTSTPELNETDQWIRENFTIPYNIEVKYRFDDAEVDNGKVLTPAKLEKVRPFLEAMKTVWIDPYAEYGGEDFVKMMVPKLLVLVGSHNYNKNGSIILGQAENGRKVTIFDINYFDPANKTIMDRIFSTMQHEFGHILHQNVMYPLEYEKITPGYTTAWMNYGKSDALVMGFITAYSMNNPNDDFVEMIAKMLTKSREEWNKYVESAYVSSWDPDYELLLKQKEEGIAKIRQKEEMVVNYFLQVWNIDLYELQAHIHEVTVNLANK